MAKRKRLTPARSDFLTEDTPTSDGLSMFPAAAPPIAQVAGDAALRAAVDDLTTEMREARAGGRLVQSLPLDSIEETHLVRDRIAADEGEMQGLIESLRARGQQTPIEVVELEPDRFGLISGWRRLSALKALHAETNEDRFATVQALLRQPDSASDAYLAMVEENEIRVGLSYYERARIAARAAEQGVYASEAEALRGLFASASRSKRSKIGSFLSIYHALDNYLKFASAIPERLGLALSKALKETPQLGQRIAGELTRTPITSAEAEAAVLSWEIKARQGENGTQNIGLESNMLVSETIGGITLKRSADGKSVALSGVPSELFERLKAWLVEQG